MWCESYFTGKVMAYQTKIFSNFGKILKQMHMLTPSKPTEGREIQKQMKL